MDLAELPPRPDPSTGEPRPPRAPGTSGDHRPQDHQYEPHELPAPPPGQGPTLEHYRLSKRESMMTGLTGLAIIVIGGLIATGGQVLFQGWPWAVPVVGGLLIAWNVRGTNLSAGADWLQSRRHWVRLYELTSIKCTTKPGGFSVLLEDAHGGSAGGDLRELQSNPALWDLVHNGVLHSVASRPVKANLAARRHLPLPPELRDKLRRDNDER